MGRILVLLIGIVALLGLASQVLLPPFLEGRVADRLERGGGSADVSLHAFPAARLLFTDGRSLEIGGRDLRLELRGRGQVLDKLDSFDRVTIRLRRVAAAPLAVRSFTLTKQSGERDYEVALTGTTSPREAARFLGSRAGGALGGLFGDFAAGTLPNGGRNRLPLRVDATVRSEHGHGRVTAATGSVAGLPAGPLVALVVDAVVRQL